MQHFSYKSQLMAGKNCNVFSISITKFFFFGGGGPGQVNEYIFLLTLDLKIAGEFSDGTNLHCGILCLRISQPCEKTTLWCA